MPDQIDADRIKSVLEDLVGCRVDVVADVNQVSYVSIKGMLTRKHRGYKIASPHGSAYFYPAHVTRAEIYPDDKDTDGYVIIGPSWEIDDE